MESTSGAPRQSPGPRFQAVKLIGRGGMGFVQLAIDTQSGEKVAIKYIDRGFSTTMFKYTLREILHHQQLSLCQHPHIVSFQEIFLTPKYLAIVMEYVDGGSLQAYLERHGGKLPEGIARFVFQQLIVAVDFIHRKGKVNRDIKLANVLVVESGKLPLVKLCDFGFSKDKFDDSAPQTQIGTALFAAPEIFLNVKGGAYDAEAVDIWSCGVVLFMLLFGGHPFLSTQDMHLPKGEQMSKLIENTVKGDLQLPPQAVGQPSGDLIQRMLMTDPDRRFKMSQIQAHPWFQDKLPPGALDLNTAYLPVLNYENARQSPEMIKHIVRVAGQALGPDGHPMGPLPAASTTTTNMDGMVKDPQHSDASGIMSRGADYGGTMNQAAHEFQRQQQEQYRQYLDQTQQTGFPGGLEANSNTGSHPQALDPMGNTFTAMLSDGGAPSEGAQVQQSLPCWEQPPPAASTAGYENHHHHHQQQLEQQYGHMPQQQFGQVQQQQQQYEEMQQQQQYGHMQQQEQWQYEHIQQQQQQQQQYGHMQQHQHQHQQGETGTAGWAQGEDPSLSRILNQVGSAALDADLQALMDSASASFGALQSIDNSMLQAVAPDPEPPKQGEGYGMDVSGAVLLNSSFMNMMQFNDSSLLQGQYQEAGNIQ